MVMPSAPAIGTPSRGFLTTAEAMARTADVSVVGWVHGGPWLGFSRFPAGALTDAGPQLSGPLVCLTDTPMVARWSAATLRRRPGIVVVWALDELLSDREALAEVCSAAAAVVVRDRVDRARVTRALGPSIAGVIRVVAPPLAWRTTIAGVSDNTSADLQIYGGGARRDAAREQRRLPLVCALRPAVFGPFPAGTVEQAAQLTDALTVRGMPAIVRLAGGCTAGDMEAARELRGGRLPGRLILGGPPGRIDLIALSTAASVHVAFASDSHAVTEALVDLALTAGRPVVAVGPPGEPHAGLVRAEPAAGVHAVAEAVTAQLATSAPIVAAPNRSPEAVADTLLALLDEVCPHGRTSIAAS
jgi:hypothetical protein